MHFPFFSVRPKRPALGVDFVDRNLEKKKTNKNNEWIKCETDLYYNNNNEKLNNFSLQSLHTYKLFVIMAMERKTRRS